MILENMKQIDKNLVKKTALLLIDNLLERKDFMYYHVDEVHGIHYAEACTAFSAMRAAYKLNDTQRLQSLIKRYSITLSDRNTEGCVINTHNHVDVNVYGIVPLEIFTLTEQTKYLEQGLSLADGQWANPLANGMSAQSRYWIDDMFMIGALQLKAYEVSGDTKYLERTALTTADYLEKLQKDNGLFHHGKEAPFYWGRGNGWCAAAMAQLLKILPQTNEHYISIKNGYIKMMNTLLQFQKEDGMWNQLIDYADSWRESSCTAMFTYSFIEGIKAGLLKETDYGSAVLKALNSLLQKLDNNGNLTEICAGTGQSIEISYYLERPRITGDLHGQAFMLYLINSVIGE